MTESQTLGLSPILRLLGESGDETHAQALIDECGGTVSLPALARCLERRGLRARVVAAASCNAAQLDATLVENDWALELLPKWPHGPRFTFNLVRYCFAERDLRFAMWLFPASIVAFSVLGYAVPVLTRNIVDHAIPEGGLHSLTVFAAALTLIGILQALAHSIKQRAAVVLDTRLTAAASHAVFAHYLRVPLSRLQKMTSGEVAQTLSCATAVIEGVAQYGVAGAINLALCAGYLLWLASIAWPLALGLIVLGALLLVCALP